LSEIKFERIIIVIALFIYLITVINSSGYYHPDEHYQIIQFAEYKSGKIDVNELPWEYNEKIRSGIQPLLCLIIFKALNFFNIYNPHHLVLFLRLITGAFSFFSIGIFIRSFKRLVEKRFYGIYILLSYFLWFLPNINVRFSSETWSGIFILLSVATAIEINGKSNKRNISLGISLGLAVLFRYQTALVAFGICSWLLLIKKETLNSLLLICSSVIAILGVGVIVDRWLYGEFTLTIYNYFNVNILHSVASNFGTSPWYEIMIYIITSPTLPLGILIATSLFIIIIKCPKSIVLWATVPFLVVHSIIPHKELRFLFPLVNLIPICIIIGLQQIKSLNFSVYFIYPFIFILTVCNTFGLIINSIKSTRRGETKISEYIYNNFKGKQVNVLTSFESNIYDPWTGSNNNFYKPSNVVTTEITSIWQPGILAKKKKNYINLIVIQNSEITGALGLKKLKWMKAVKLVHNIPDFAFYPLYLYDSSIIDRQLNLYILN